LGRAISLALEVKGMALSLIIVDPEEISRKGLIALMRTGDELNVIGEATSLAEALEVSRARRPNIVMVKTFALSEEERKGISELHEKLPDVGILVVASKAEQVISAVKAGARGFMTTEADTKTILDAVRSVGRGEVVFSKQAILQLVDLLSLPESKTIGSLRLMNGIKATRPKLTTREAQVLGLVSKGASNKQIASRLVISEHTVRAHLRNILDKLGLDNRIQAATWATRLGLDRDVEGIQESPAQVIAR
jgi:DNA-binding NarL/FixJ family response regulator